MEDQSTQRILVALNHIQPRFYPQLYTLLRNRHQTDEIHLLRVVAAMPAVYFQIPSMTKTDEIGYQFAKSELCEAGKLLQVPTEQQWFCQGYLMSHVKRLTKELNIEKLVYYQEGLHVKDIDELLSFRYKLNCFFDKFAKCNAGYHRPL